MEEIAPVWYFLTGESSAERSWQLLLPVAG